MIRKFTLTIISAIALLGSAMAQDAEFSQFYAAPIYLNPALAGSSDAPRVGLNYRDQWPGLNAFVQYAVSYDQPIKALNGGIGLFIMQDDAGDGVFKTTHIDIAYAYNLRLGNNSVIKPAIKASFFQSTFDNSRLTYGYDANGNRLDATATGETVLSGSKSAPDVGVGAIISSKIAFAGFAVDHLLNPNIAFGDQASNLPMKITVHAGSNISVGGRGSNSSISPNILFQNQGSASQLNLGFYYNLGPLVLGAWYRYAFTNSEAFIPLVGFKTGKFRIGYSYDLGLSEIRAASGGAHEVSLSLDFNNPAKKSNATPWSRINCPSF